MENTMITRIDTKPIDEAIGAAVRARREAENRSPEQAADACALALTRYEAAESGRVPLQASELFALASYLRCQPRDLMPREGEIELVRASDRYGDAEDIRNLIHYFSGVVSPELRKHLLQQIEDASVHGRSDNTLEVSKDVAPEGRKSLNPFRLLKAS